MQTQTKKEKPVCPKCGSSQIRFRADQTLLCQRCGYDTKQVKP